MRSRIKIAVIVLTILLSFLLLLETGCNCQNQEITQSQPATEIKDKAFIWKISSDTTHVYLLGSVHMANKNIYPLDKTIEDTFSSANYLVVEVNSNNISQDVALQLLMDYGQYPEGEWLSKNLPEELYNKLATQLRAFNIELSFMDGFKPFVSYNIMSQCLMENLGYKSEYGIDLYFTNKAQESNISILELETAEYQMALISSVPDEVMITMMQYDIENPEIEKYLQELFNAWLNGDTAKMETLIFEPLIEEPEMAPYYEMMYDQRNSNMIKIIEDFLADDEIYFIVVGAGHLVGENGLIIQLKDRGYTVEQLDKSD